MGAHDGPHRRPPQQQAPHEPPRAKRWGGRDRCNRTVRHRHPSSCWWIEQGRRACGSAMSSPEIEGGVTLAEEGGYLARLWRWRLKGGEGAFRRPFGNFKFVTRISAKLLMDELNLAKIS